MARFEREAEVLASLNHPNIEAIYGVEDRALVMELVEGSAPKGPLPFDEAWKIASQIAAALEYEHDKGIMHRDVKPATAVGAWPSSAAERTNTPISCGTTPSPIRSTSHLMTA
jgi:serine/threonine protein kinase